MSENLWYRARATYPGAEPIELMAVLTTDPETYKQGLELMYEGALVEVWPVDERGNPIQLKTIRGE